MHIIFTMWVGLFILGALVGEAWILKSLWTAKDKWVVVPVFMGSCIVNSFLLMIVWQWHLKGYFCPWG